MYLCTHTYILFIYYAFMQPFLLRPVYSTKIYPT